MREATERQISYAKTISEALKIKEPDFTNIDATSAFLEKHKDEFNKVMYGVSMPARIDFIAYKAKSYKKRKKRSKGKTTGSSM